MNDVIIGGVLMDKRNISYLTLRRAIGILAILFPFILIVAGLFDGPSFETSISAYYWTNAGVLFSGMLLTFSIFLFSYKGYDLADDIITNIGAFGMLTVALFPCEGGSVYLFQFIPPGATAVIHYVAAGVTFSALGVMSFVQFPKSDYPATSKTKKAKRNRIYRACGITIFATLALAAVVQVIPGGRSVTDPVRLWYWLESIILWAFGVGWLVKGETILKD